MKKILLLIGIIIALTIIVHAETKDRREVMMDRPSQEASSYETLTLMRDIIDIQARMIKGSENKKTMLRELTQLRDKTDRLILKMNLNQTVQRTAAPLGEQGQSPTLPPQARTSPAGPPAGMP
ncbi:MAG: hypothetical protein ABFD81_05870 [Syntrophaceae bacterium]